MAALYLPVCEVANAAGVDPDVVFTAAAEHGVRLMLRLDSVLTQWLTLNRDEVGAAAPFTGWVEVDWTHATVGASKRKMVNATFWQVYDPKEDRIGIFPRPESYEDTYHYNKDGSGYLVPAPPAVRFERADFHIEAPNVAKLRKLMGWDLAGPPTALAATVEPDRATAKAALALRLTVEAAWQNAAEIHAAVADRLSGQSVPALRARPDSDALQGIAELVPEVRACATNAVEIHAAGRPTVERHGPLPPLLDFADWQQRAGGEGNAAAKMAAAVMAAKGRAKGNGIETLRKPIQSALRQK